MNSKEQKIQRTLDSLDGMQRASAGPFFYTRVSAALQKQRVTAWDRISNLISRPVVAIATVCVVLAVNMAVIVDQSAGSAVSSDPADLAVVDEYTIATAGIYDYENPEVR